MKKKLLALVLAVAMALSMTVAVSAAAEYTTQFRFTFTLGDGITLADSYSAPSNGQTIASFTLPTADELVGATETLLGWNVNIASSDQDIEITTEPNEDGYYAPGTTITCSTYTGPQNYTELAITPVWEETSTGDDTTTDAPIASEEGNVIVKIEDTTDVPEEGSSETDDPDVETIYSVEIIWGDLTFEWKAPKVWDPETHTYVDAESGEEWTISNNDTLKNGAGDEILDADGNALRHDSVVVYNHSNARLNAEFTLTNTDTTVTANIDQNTVEVGAAIINNVYDDAARVIATVSLSDDNKADFADWFSGHENDGTETVTIATVTVTITKVAE